MNERAKISEASIGTVESRYKDDAVESEVELVSLEVPVIKQVADD